jgi:hypothetical protein
LNSFIDPHTNKRGKGICLDRIKTHRNSPCYCKNGQPSLSKRAFKPEQPKRGRSNNAIRALEPQQQDRSPAPTTNDQTWPDRQGNELAAAQNPCHHSPFTASSRRAKASTVSSDKPQLKAQSEKSAADLEQPDPDQSESKAKPQTGPSSDKCDLAQ